MAVEGACATGPELVATWAPVLQGLSVVVTVAPVGQGPSVLVTWAPVGQGPSVVATWAPVGQGPSVLPRRSCDFLAWPLLLYCQFGILLTL